MNSAVPPLGDLLDDDEWIVRYAAGKALRDLGAPGVELLQTLADSEVSRRQRTASLVLSEGASPAEAAA